MIYDYNKLHAFMVVAEEGSFTKAASRLKRSQPAITQQIQILEEQLNIRLFKRQGAKITLSPQGQVLYKAGQKMFQQFDKELDQMLGATESIAGHITVGLAGYEATKLRVEPIIGAFCRDHPEVTVSIELGLSHEIEDKLLDDKLDIGLLVDIHKPHRLETFRVSSAKQQMVTSPHYFGVAKELLDKGQIAQLRYIDFTSEFLCIKPWIKLNFPELLPAFAHRDPDVLVPSHLAVKMILLTGAGCAVVPDYLIEHELKEQTLIPLIPDTQAVAVHSVLATRKERTLRLCEKMLVDHIKGIA